MFERFTDAGRRVVAQAQEESRIAGSPHIGSEHLLLALLVRPEPPSQVLGQAGLTLDDGRRWVRNRWPATTFEASGYVPFSPDAKAALEAAVRIAERRDDRTAGPVELLAGVLEVRPSVARELLGALGVDAEAVLEAATASEHGPSPQTKEAWEERYRSSPQSWSGNVNPVLVTEVADLTPGTALDAGAGEGGDAVWLAGRGWSVTAADFSPTALERTGARAAAEGRHLTLLEIDLTRQPLPGRYDLVSAFFLHLPQPGRARAFGHLRDAVAPGGTLLVVGHDVSDCETTVARPHLKEMGWTLEEVGALLDDAWTVEVAEARARLGRDHEGRDAVVHDTVFRAKRGSR